METCNTRITKLKEIKNKTDLEIRNILEAAIKQLQLVTDEVGSSDSNSNDVSFKWKIIFLALVDWWARTWWKCTILSVLCKSSQWEATEIELRVKKALTYVWRVKSNYSLESCKKLGLEREAIKCKAILQFIVNS